MRRSASARAGLTLLELVVVLAVISLLISILLPAVLATRAASRDLECRTHFKTICQDFNYFADVSGIGARGDSDKLGDDRFLIEDFQESIYGIAEFWQGSTLSRRPIDGKGTLLLCPASNARLQKVPRIPCSSGAVEPQQDVSAGFNRRLFIRTRYVNDMPLPTGARLSSKILHFPDVPLVLDVDGRTARQKGAQPYYTAPAITNDKVSDIYEDGAFWFPSTRHRGRVNVGFVGGHVLSSTEPTAEPWWRWDYQPDT